MEDIAGSLEALLRAGRYRDLEAQSREQLARQRFYLWHLYLVVALLRLDRREEAGRELDDLFTYKFNIADRAWPEVKAAFPEKFEGHFILSTMKPGASFEAAPPVPRRWTVPVMADRGTFEAAVDRLLGQAVPALPPYSRETTQVTTFGSCFAANLARILRDTGAKADNLLIEESINSPQANRLFLEAAAGRGDAAFAARIEAAFGAGFLAKARERLAAAQVLVLTLGVAPGFYHRDSGAFSFLENYRELLAAGQVVMRTPSTAETKTVLAEVLALLRSINPAARIYVSVSPVPLLGTAEFSDEVLADTISKSTLRVALHEVMQEAQLEGVHYWPSFEIVRWLSSHSTLPVYGADDGNSRHVSNWVVELVVDRFSTHLFGA